MLNNEQNTTEKLGSVWMDRRLEERNEIRFMLVAILLADPDLRRIPIETTDLSSHGIGFFSKHCFEPGTYFAVRLHVDGRPAKLMLCRSSFSEPKNGGNYRNGGEILETVSSEATLEIPAEWVRLATGNKN